MRYIFGIIGIVIGFLIIWKSEKMLQWFGRVDWAEQKFAGGTRIFYKLLGVVIIIVSFLLMGGGLQAIILRLFAPTLR